MSMISYSLSQGRLKILKEGRSVNRILRVSGGRGVSLLLQSLLGENLFLYRRWQRREEFWIDFDRSGRFFDDCCLGALSYTLKPQLFGDNFFAHIFRQSGKERRIDSVGQLLFLLLSLLGILRL